MQLQQSKSQNISMSSVHLKAIKYSQDNLFRINCILFQKNVNVIEVTIY
jgi:hypothetical protein